MQPEMTYRYPRPAARSGPWRWLGIGCGGLTALLLCACLGLAAAGGGAKAQGGGAATGGAAAARGGGGAAGATLATKHWQVEVTSAARYKTLYWNSYGGRQDAAGEWLLLTITLTNIGEENYGVNTWDFAVRDRDGKLYRHSNEWVALTHPERQGYQSASNRQVPPGLSVPIMLVFDVNPAASGLELVLMQERQPRVALP